MKKHPVGRPRTTGTTPLSTFRLSEETQAEITAIMSYCNIGNRTEVVRQAVRLMAQMRLGAVAEPPVKLPPKRKAKR